MASFQVAPAIQAQLAGGMLPHLNSYLQVRGLRGQLSGSNVELVPLGAAVPGHQQLEEIQMELLRLASLQRSQARGCQAPDARVQAGRTAAASSSTEPAVVGSLEVGSEIHKQLTAGMLYHLNRYLRHHGVQGRLRTGSFQLELLCLGGHAPPHLDEVEMELLRLASLRQELTETWRRRSLDRSDPAEDRIPVSQPMVKRLIGPQGHVCRMLSRDLGVQAGLRQYR